MAIETKEVCRQGKGHGEAGPAGEGEGPQSWGGGSAAVPGTVAAQERGRVCVCGGGRNTSLRGNAEPPLLCPRRRLLTTA